MSHSRRDVVALFGDEPVAERPNPSAEAPPSLLSRLARAYSIKRNWHALFSAPASRATALDGMRGIAFIWVVMTHTVILRCFFLNRDQVITLYQAYEDHWWARFLLRGDNCMDVFFVLSGYLIANILMEDHERHGAIRLGLFYTRRFMRLIPLYATVLFFIAAVASQSPNAENANIGSLWSNLLYVNNFLPMPRQFAPWTWSLAVEEQFYILFPVLLMLVYKLRSRRLWIFIGLLVAAFVVRGYVAYARGLSLPHVNPAVDREAGIRYFEQMHSNLYTRFGPIIVGIIVAYASKYTRLADRLRAQRGWQAAALAFTLLWSGFGFVLSTFDPSTHWSRTSSIVYFACYDNIFAIGIGIIIFMLVNKLSIARPLEKLFSWKIFYPVAQVSYCGYLVHPVVAFGFYSQGHLFAEPFSIKLVTAFLFIFGVSCVVSVILFLAVEKPMMNLRPR